MPTETDDLMRTSVMLLDRLRDLDDQASWQRFFDRYWRLIYSVARRSGFTEAAAQDIVQETFVTVSRHMPQFRYDPKIGSFKTWLLQITRSRIYDALRRTRYKHEGHYSPREIELGTTLMESFPGQEATTLEDMWEDEWRKHQIETALEQIKGTADANEFRMFYLHVIKNVPARDVARGLGTKLAAVYAAKYKLEPRMERELKRVTDQP
jgi:RNA polymerase sigma factor (sigma-70 family)